MSVARTEFVGNDAFRGLSPERKTFVIESVASKLSGDEKNSFLERANAEMEDIRRSQGVGRHYLEGKVQGTLSSVLPEGYNDLSDEEKLTAIDSALPQISQKASEIDPVNKGDTAFYAESQLSSEMRKILGKDVGDVGDKSKRFLGGLIQSFTAPFSEDGTQNWLNRNFPTNPNYDNTNASALTTAAGDFVGQIGQFAAIMALAPETGGASLGLLSLRGGAGAAMAVSTAQNASRKFQENYNLATGEMGLSEDEALQAGIAAMPGAVIDSFGDALLLKGIKVGTAGKAFKSMTAVEKAAEIVAKGGSILKDPTFLKSASSNALKGFMKEGITETLGDAATGWGGYATSGHEGFKPSSESLWQSFWIGGVLGGGFNTIANTGKDMRNTSALKELGKIDQSQFVSMGEDAQARVAEFMDKEDYASALSVIKGFKSVTGQKPAPENSGSSPASNNQLEDGNLINKATGQVLSPEASENDLLAGFIRTDDAVSDNLSKLKLANVDGRVSGVKARLLNANPVALNAVRKSLEISFDPTSPDQAPAQRVSLGELSQVIEGIESQRSNAKNTPEPKPVTEVEQTPENKNHPAASKVQAVDPPLAAPIEEVTPEAKVEQVKKVREKVSKAAQNKPVEAVSTPLAVDTQIDAQNAPVEAPSANEVIPKVVDQSSPDAAPKNPELDKFLDKVYGDIDNLASPSTLRSRAKKALDLGYIRKVDYDNVIETQKSMGSKDDTQDAFDELRSALEYAKDLQNTASPVSESASENTGVPVEFTAEELQDAAEDVADIQKEVDDSSKKVKASKTKKKQKEKQEKESNELRETILKRIENMLMLAKYKAAIDQTFKSKIPAVETIADSLRSKVSSGNLLKIIEANDALDEYATNGQMVSKKDVDQIISRLNERAKLPSLQKAATTAIDNIKGAAQGGMLFQGGDGAGIQNTPPYKNLSELTDDELKAAKEIISLLKRLGINDQATDADKLLAVEVKQAVDSGNFTEELINKLNTAAPSRAEFQNKINKLVGFGFATKRQIMIHFDVMALNYMKTGLSLQAFWAGVPDVVVVEAQDNRTKGALMQGELDAKRTKDKKGGVPKQINDVSMVNDKSVLNFPFSPVPNRIILFRGNYNASTVIHENDHNMIVTGMAQRVIESQDGGVDLWNEVLTVLGLKRGDQWTVEAHEKWAIAREAWIRGGEVQSVFRKAFNALKAIFTNLYTSDALDKYRNPTLEKAFVKIYDIGNEYVATDPPASIALPQSNALNRSGVETSPDGYYKYNFDTDEGYYNPPYVNNLNAGRIGWKISLKTNNRYEVSQYLKNTGLAHKVGHGGETGENDVTIYIGDKNEMMFFADKINKEIPTLLGDNPKTSNRFINNKVSARFASYDFGSNMAKEGPDGGIMLANDVPWGEDGMKNELLKIRPELINKSEKILTDIYGKYYTGSPDGEFNQPINSKGELVDLFYKWSDNEFVAKPDGTVVTHRAAKDQSKKYVSLKESIKEYQESSQALTLEEKQGLTEDIKAKVSRNTGEEAGKLLAHIPANKLEKAQGAINAAKMIPDLGEAKKELTTIATTIEGGQPAFNDQEVIAMTGVLEQSMTGNEAPIGDPVYDEVANYFDSEKGSETYYGAVRQKGKPRDITSPNTLYQGNTPYTEVDGSDVNQRTPIQPQERKLALEGIKRELKKSIDSDGSVIESVNTRRSFIKMIVAATTSLYVAGCSNESIEQQVARLSKEIKERRLDPETEKLIDRLINSTSKAKISLTGLESGVEELASQIEEYVRSGDKKQIKETNVINPITKVPYTFIVEDAIKIGNEIISNLSDKFDLWSEAIYRVAGIVSDITGEDVSNAVIKFPTSPRNMLLEASWRKDILNYGASTSQENVIVIHPNTALGLISDNIRMRLVSAATIANELTHVAQNNKKQKNGNEWDSDFAVLDKKIELPKLVELSYLDAIKSLYSGTQHPIQEKESFDVAWVATKAYNKSKEPVVSTEEISEYISTAISGFVDKRGMSDEKIIDRTSRDIYENTSLFQGNIPYTEVDGSDMNPRVLYQFGGEKANKPKFIEDSLETAKAMALAGKSQEEIRAITGWFPSPYDGKMRWEIPDNEAALNIPEWMDIEAGSLMRKNLGDLLNHDAFFDAYPNARNVHVYGMESGGSYAADTIWLGKYFGDDKRSLRTLLHEIQHWIQDEEGFPRGSYISPFPRKDGFYDIEDSTYSINEVLPIWSGIEYLDSVWSSLSDRERAILNDSVYDENIELFYDKDSYPYLRTEGITGDDAKIIMQAWKNLIPVLNSNKNKPEIRGDKLLELEKAIATLAKSHEPVFAITPEERYIRTSGEIEARDTEARANYTPEQRAAIAPYSSENISKEEAIVLYQGNIPYTEVGELIPAGGGFFYNMAPFANGKIGKHTLPKNGIVDEAVFLRIARGGDKPLKGYELELYKEIAPKAFSDGKVNVALLQDGLRNAKPATRVDNYSQGGVVTPEKRELDKLRHDWFDNLSYQAQTLVNSRLANDRLGQMAMARFASDVDDNKYDRYEELVYLTSKKNIKGLRATSSYDEISPFDARDYPVERIDVSIPVKDGDEEKWVQDDTHENLPNTIGWAMVQVVPDPDTGEDVMFVAEQQSRWWQNYREQISSEIKDLKDKAGVGISNRSLWTPYSNVGRKLEREFGEDFWNRDFEKADLKKAAEISAGNENAPLLEAQHELVMKAVFREAQKRGITKVAISDGETAMMTELHDQANEGYLIPSRDVPSWKGIGGASIESIRQKDGDYFIPKILKRLYVIDYSKYEISFQSPSQDGGMRLHYDITLPSVAKSITGVKGVRKSFGQHKNTPNGSPVFKNQDGTPKSDVTALVFDVPKANNEKSSQLFLFQGNQSGDIEYSDPDLRAMIGYGHATVQMAGKLGIKVDYNKINKAISILVNSQNRRSGKTYKQSTIQAAAKSIYSSFNDFYVKMSEPSQIEFAQVAYDKAHLIEELDLDEDSFARKNNIRKQKNVPLTVDEQERMKIQESVRSLYSIFKNARSNNVFKNKLGSQIKPEFYDLADRIISLINRGIDNVMGAFNSSNQDLLIRFADNISAYTKNNYEGTPEFVDQFNETVGEVEEATMEHIVRQFYALNSAYIDAYGINDDINALLEQRGRKEGETAMEYYERLVKIIQAVEASMFELGSQGDPNGESDADKQSRKVREKREAIAKSHQRAMLEKFPTVDDLIAYKREKDGGLLIEEFENVYRENYDIATNSNISDLSDVELREFNSNTLTLLVGGSNTGFLNSAKRKWRKQKIESWVNVVQQMKDRAVNSPLIRPIYRSAARSNFLQRQLNNFDKGIQAKVENFHVWVDRFSQYAPVRDWFDRQFFAEFTTGAFTQAENARKASEAWIQDTVKDYNKSGDTTVEANPYLWVMSILSQYNLGADRNKGFAKAVVRARTSIKRTIDQKRSAMLVTAAERNLAALDYMLDGVNPEADNSYDMFMNFATIGNRLGAGDAQTTEKRLELLSSINQFFQQDVANQKFIRENIFGESFVTVVNYLPLKAMKVDGSVDNWDWTSIEPNTERQVAAQNVNKKSNEERSDSLGSERAYTMDFFNMVERKAVKNALDRHAIFPVAILSDIFKTETKTIDGVSVQVPKDPAIKQIFGSQPEVVNQLAIIKEKITHQMVQIYGVTEPPTEFVGGLKKVIGVVQASMLSGVGQIAQQSAAAVVDYSAREKGNVGYMIDAMLYWSKNYSKVREWLKENNRDIYDRGNTQGILEFERHVNNAGTELNSMLDKGWKGVDQIRKFMTLSLRYGDKIGAELIFLAEHMKAVKESGQMPTNGDYDILAYNNPSYTDRANSELAKFVGPSSAAGRSYWMSDHKQAYFLLRALTGSFQSSAHNMSSQMLSAARNIRGLKDDNSKEGREERQAEYRKIGSIMAQQATFTGVRYLVGAAITYALVAAIKDAWDDEEGSIAEAQLELDKANKKKYPSKAAKEVAVAMAERQLADAKAIRRAVVNMKQQASGDSLMKSMVRDQLQNLHIVGSVGDGFALKPFMLVPNSLAEQSHIEAQDLVVSKLKKERSNALNIGDRKKAARISESIADAQSVEYIPFFYNKRDSSGFGGIVGGVIDPIYTGMREGVEDMSRDDKDFLTARAFVPDMITYMAAVGLGQADVNRVAKQLQKIDDQLSKNRKEADERKGENVDKLINKPNTPFLK